MNNSYVNSALFPMVSVLYAFLFIASFFFWLFDKDTSWNIRMLCLQGKAYSLDFYCNCNQRLASPHLGQSHICSTFHSSTCWFLLLIFTHFPFFFSNIFFHLSLLQWFMKMGESEYKNHADLAIITLIFTIIKRGDVQDR